MTKSISWIHLSIIIFAISPSASSQAADFRDLQPQPFTLFQTQSLEQDKPFNSIFIPDQDRPELYIVGARSLWIYNLMSKKLEKLHLARNKEEFISHTFKTKKQILLTVGSSLLAIDTESKILTHFKLPSPEPTIAVTSNSNHHYWFTKKNVYQLSPKDQTLTVLGIHQYLREEDVPVVTTNTETTIVLVARNKTIFSFELNQLEHPLQVAQQTYTKIVDLQQIDQRYFALTTDALLETSFEGKILNAIPATRQRTIMAADLRSNSHSYLLQDGTIESYDLKTKRSYYSYLKTELNAKHRAQIQYALGYCATLVDQDIKLYKLSSSSLSYDSTSKGSPSIRY